MIVFEYEKKENGWIVKGKAKPCSSKSKMFNYAFKAFCKQFPDTTEGKITIEGGNNEIANTR